MEIDKVLLLWKLTPDHSPSVPISHQKVCAELSAIFPEIPGQETLNQLRCSNLVEVDIHGNYVLTYHGLILRRQIPDQPMPSASSRESRTGHEWDRFRKVVSYYIECVHLQERTQEYRNRPAWYILKTG